MSNFIPAPPPERGRQKAVYEVLSCFDGEASLTEFRELAQATRLAGRTNRELLDDLRSATNWGYAVESEHMRGSPGTFRLASADEYIERQEFVFRPLGHCSDAGRQKYLRNAYAKVEAMRSKHALEQAANLNKASAALDRNLALQAGRANGWPTQAASIAPTLQEIGSGPEIQRALRTPNDPDKFWASVGKIMLPVWVAAMTFIAFVALS